MKKPGTFIAKLYLKKLSLPVFLLLLTFQVYFGIAPGWRSIIDDFPNYYVSARLLSEHQDLSVLYNNELFNERVKPYGLQPIGQFALYSPPNALILLPLSALSPLAAKRAWLTMNILLIIACGFLIKKITSWNWIHSLNILFISGFALANDLFLGQVYLLLTTALLAGYLLFQNKKFRIAGTLWGIVLALKYATIVFIPSLILKKQWKVLLGILSGTLLLYISCLPFFSLNIFSHYFSHVLIPHMTGLLYEGHPYSIQYQSFDSLLNNLFVPDPIFNPNPIFSSLAAFLIIKFILLATVIFILSYFFLRTIHDPYFYDITFSLSLISLLLIEPGSATYHNLFLILPFILLLRLIAKDNIYSAFIYTAIFILIGFLPSLLNKFTLFNGGNIILSYHRLWLQLIFYCCSIWFLHRMTKPGSIPKTIQASNNTL